MVKLTHDELSGMVWYYNKWQSCLWCKVNTNRIDMFFEAHICSEICEKAVIKDIMALEIPLKEGK